MKSGAENAQAERNLPLVGTILVFDHSPFGTLAYDGPFWAGAFGGSFPAHRFSGIAKEHFLYLGKHPWYMNCKVWSFSQQRIFFMHQLAIEGMTVVVVP